MASYSSDSVLVAEAAVLYAPLNTALPDETTVAWNTFAGWTGWTMLGYTTQASTFSYSYDVFEVDVQQSLAPIKRRKTSETATISTALAQFEGEILALVLSGTNTNTAAGASQKGWSRVVTGGDPALDEYMFALEGWREDSGGNKQPVRIFVYRGTITVNGDIPFDKNAVTSVPVTINALADAGKSVGAQLMEIHIVTAPASS
jgi:hypothetical protein